MCHRLWYNIYGARSILLPVLIIKDCHVDARMIWMGIIQGCMEMIFFSKFPFKDGIDWRMLRLLFFWFMIFEKHIFLIISDHFITRTFFPLKNHPCFTSIPKINFCKLSYILLCVRGLFLVDIICSVSRVTVWMGFAVRFFGTNSFWIFDGKFS